MKSFLNPFLSSIKAISVSCLLSFSCFNAIGQIGGYGSPYSRYGIGDLQRGGSVLNNSMGGTGVGMRSVNGLNLLNPASFNSLLVPTNVRFEAGFSLSSLAVSNSQESNNVVDATIDYAALWMRVSPRSSIAFGLMPYSLVGYNIKGEKTFLQGVQEQVSYEGDGGLNKFFFGIGHQLSNRISIGFNLSLLFGNLHYDESYTSGFIAGTTLSETIGMFGTSADFGIQYSIPLSGNGSLVIGATATPEVKLLAGSVEQDFVQAAQVVDFDFSPVDDYAMPATFAGGLSYYNGKGLTVNADYQFKPISQSSFLGNEISLVNGHRWGLGAEYVPDITSLSFWKRVTFRGGWYIDQSVTELKYRQLTEQGGSVGISLPIGLFNHIHLNYMQAVRGTYDNGLLKERQHKLSLNVSISDRWFHKRRIN